MKKLFYIICVSILVMSINPLLSDSLLNEGTDKSVLTSMKQVQKVKKLALASQKAIIQKTSLKSIGKITLLRGEVSITRNTKQLTARLGTSVEKNDFIKTSKNSKIQIDFIDKTLFTIGQNSTLKISKYLYDEKKPSKNKAKFDVLKGAFTSISGRIAKLNRAKFKLHTRSASIGIRGTQVVANQETVMCTQGAISVSTLSGISVDIDAGSKVSTEGDSQGVAESIEAGDELGIGAKMTAEDKKASRRENLANLSGVTSAEISNMRTSGMGWGEIANELGMHPGAIGLGHAKKAKFDSKARSRDTKGFSNGQSTTSNSQGNAVGLSGKASSSNGNSGGNSSGGAAGSASGNANSGSGNSNAGGNSNSNSNSGSGNNNAGGNGNGNGNNK